MKAFLVFLTGKAITYKLGMWLCLERCITDGRFEIDNNLIENVISPFALGCKNYLFSSSVRPPKTLP